MARRLFLSNVCKTALMCLCTSFAEISLRRAISVEKAKILFPFNFFLACPSGVCDDVWYGIVTLVCHCHVPISGVWRVCVDFLPQRQHAQRGVCADVCRVLYLSV